MKKKNNNFMSNTVNDVLRSATENYLQSIDADNPPAPSEIEAAVLEEIAAAFDAENQMLPKERKWKFSQTLRFQQIAQIVNHLYSVRRIAMAGLNVESEYDVLAIYQTDGPDKGIYVMAEEAFRNIARSYNYAITTREFNEFMTALKDIAPRAERCHEPNLIAVNNGIFDYSTKQLMDFSPEYVFMTKTRIDYNPNAQNAIISGWDVESWMKELSDDPEIVNLLWEILGAVVRPNVSWNKSAWFYGENGSNGKGTLCELMRQLCGNGSYASIPLSEMGKDFMLEPLTKASAIIVDENDVGTYIDKAANLKAIITNDVISINRKFKQAVPYRFYGFMVQCLNEMPKVKDNSSSFWRRQLFIPFTKCFTGMERKEIKDDYLHRKDVLEYVLCRVLNMNYDSLSVPEACKEALEEYKTYNDPVRQFIEEIIPQLQWDLVPGQILYALYKAWYRENNPRRDWDGKTRFFKQFRELMKENSEWDCSDMNTNRRTGKKMSRPEPLIEEYGLTKLMKQKGYMPMTKKFCNGMVRTDAGEYAECA